MRNIILLTTVAVLAACSQTETEKPNENAAGVDNTAAAEETSTVAADDGASPPQGSALEMSFPVAIRGTWRETEGRAPGAEACDKSAVPNMGRILTVQEDRYTFFETGGTFISVSRRTPGELRAVFDTTYADEEARDDLTFAVDPGDKTLTVINHFESGPETVVYMRCP